MGPVSWETLQQILAEALERPESERDTFIDTSVSDPTAQAELRALLDAYASSPLPEDDEDVDALPEQIGPYQIVRPLADGGMSRVYLARHNLEATEQLVAMKVLPIGLDGDGARRRFRAEQVILARLAHPNIARLLDSGVVGSRPFLILEYVKGRPVTEHCRGQGLAQVLRLFIEICSAVDFAHRHLVVHRDLKPSNVLIDASGRPKLLDFGVAKVLDEGLGEALTRPSRPAGLTPEYASPEQILGQPVSTASDVYALGVLLHELITERKLISLTTTQRRVPVSALTVPKPRPSRILPPRSVRARQVEGDLDTIVMKAIEAEPERRYQRAEDLARDITNFLHDRPIEARPSSILYRLRMLVRRQTAAFAIGTAALLASLTLGYSTIDRHLKLRIKQRESAAVQVFLTDLLQSADPDRGTDVTLLEVIDRGAARVHDELQDEPEVRAELLDVMGRVYISLQQPERGQRLLGEALEARAETLGYDHPKSLSTRLALARELARRGDFVGGAERFAEVVTATEGATEGPLMDLRAQGFNGLGICQLLAGDPRTGEAAIAAAYDLRRRADPTNEQQLAQSHLNLGWIRGLQGELVEAQAHLRESVRLRRRGAVKPNLALGLGHLGELLTTIGALQESREVLEEAQVLAGPYVERGYAVGASTTSRLSVLALAQGRGAEAARDAELADHLHLGWNEQPPWSVIDDHLRGIGVWLALGEVDRAAASLTSARELVARAGLSAEWIRARVEARQAELYRAQGDALAAVTRASEVLMMSPSDPTLRIPRAQAALTMAEVFRDWDLEVPSQDHAWMAYSIITSTLGPGHAWSSRAKEILESAGLERPTQGHLVFTR